MNEDVLTQSATELLARMRRGELSSSQLIQMTLERIETIVPFLATDQSLPLGVQIISAAGEEAMALAVADRLERSGFACRAPTTICQS